MTDKELRKLSRLELLELLLEVSKENQKLKDQIDNLTQENKTAQNIENLSKMTHQMEASLKQINNLTITLKRTNAQMQHTDAHRNADTKPGTTAESGCPSDKEIYKRILSFLAKNDDKLDMFPDDIQQSVRARIHSILEKRNKG